LANLSKVHALEVHDQASVLEMLVDRMVEMEEHALDALNDACHISLQTGIGKGHVRDCFHLDAL
jgi:hypothetical protein